MLDDLVKTWPLETSHRDIGTSADLACAYRNAFLLQSLELKLDRWPKVRLQLFEKGIYSMLLELVL